MEEPWLSLWKGNSPAREPHLQPQERNPQPPALKTHAPKMSMEQRLHPTLSLGGGGSHGSHAALLCPLARSISGTGFCARRETLLAKDPEPPSRICRFLRDKLPGAVFLQRMLQLPVPVAEPQHQRHRLPPAKPNATQLKVLQSNATLGGKGRGVQPETFDIRRVRETAGLGLCRHSRLHRQVRDRLVHEPALSHIHKVAG